MNIDKIWRYIPFKQYDPFVKTALNELLIEEVSNTLIPVVWLSAWERDCINLGVSQDFEKVINYEQIKKDDILVLRRQSGGGATFLDSECDISWAVIIPQKYLHEDINKIYEEVCNKIIDELKSNGIDAYFKPINDIRTQNGKISGSTLRKEKGVVYVGGTMLYKADKSKMNKYLNPQNDNLKKEKIEENKKEISSISKESNLSYNETIQILKKSFLRNQNYEEKKLTKEELLKAKEISVNYETKQWIRYGIK